MTESQPTATDFGVVLACDLGGTRLRVATLEDGSILEKEAMTTPKEDPHALARALGAIAAKLGRRIAAVVVGVPGPVDYRRGKVLRLPNLHSWEGRLDLATLGADLSLPVLLANDADLAALGEHRFGAGRGWEDMAYVTSSTGVGAGIIVGGRLLHGIQSLAEIGHTIIDFKTGATVEQLGSGTALRSLAGEDAARVGDKALRGDKAALKQVATVAAAFAVGVFNLVHCFSPQVVVVGGGMAGLGDLLLEPIRKALRACEDDCPASRVQVFKTQNGDDAGLLGAFAYWSDYCQAHQGGMR